MTKQKQINLILVAGLILLSSAVVLNRYPQIPDFFKGLGYGIGIGLLILFVIKISKQRKIIEQ